MNSDWTASVDGDWRGLDQEHHRAGSERRVVGDLGVLSYGRRLDEMYQIGCVESEE